MDREFLTTDKKLFEAVIWLDGQAYAPKFNPGGFQLCGIKSTDISICPAPNGSWSMGNELWHGQSNDFVDLDQDQLQLRHWQKTDHGIQLLGKIPCQSGAGCPQYHDQGGYLWIEENETGARICLNHYGVTIIVDESQDHYRQLRWNEDGSSFLAVAWKKGELAWEASRLLWFQRADQGRFHATNLAALHPEGLGYISQALFAGPDQIIACARFEDEESLYSFDGKSWRWQRIPGSSGYFYSRPPWNLMESTLAFSRHRQTMLAIRRRFGRSELVEFDLHFDRCQVISELSEWTYLKNLSLSEYGDNAYLEGASYLQSLSLIHLDLNNEIKATVVISGRGQQLAALPRLSKPETFPWSSQGNTAGHGYFYRSDVANEKQALLVLIHGGPYQEVECTWPLKAHAFNPLGYAVAYLNYSGSSGQSWTHYHSLDGQWGIRDAEDVVSAVRKLCQDFPVDSKRIVLWGGAAGGFTVLKSLSLAPDLFAGGIVVYPYLNLKALVDKADSCLRDYLSRLFIENKNSGITELALSASQISYKQLSQIRSPLAIFHGQKDQKVSWLESQKLAETLTGLGCQAYTHFYPDLGHYWTEKDSLLRYYQDVQTFLQKISQEV